MTSPTQLSLAALRAEGYTAQVVERWNPYARIRQDLFGFVDIVAIRDGETLGVQTTSASCMSARVRKIADAEHLAVVRAAGWRIEVHGWRKRKVKRDGKAERWRCRVVDVS